MGVVSLVLDFVLATLTAERIQHEYQLHAMNSNWQEMFIRKSFDIPSIQNSVPLFPHGLNPNVCLTYGSFNAVALRPRKIALTPSPVRISRRTHALKNTDSQNLVPPHW